jgi:hypothetical protein
MIKAIEFLKIAKEIPTPQVWRPSEVFIAECLPDSVDVVPSGGWSNFISLLSGTPYAKAFQTHIEIFDVPTPEPKVLRESLIQAFTKKFVPPSVMAAFGVSVDLHPLYMLKAAWEGQSGQYGDDERILLAGRIMSDACGGFCSLAKSKSNGVWSHKEWESAIHSECVRINDSVMRGGIQFSGDGLAVGGSAALAQSIMSGVLIPAGVIVDDGSNFMVIQ